MNKNGASLTRRINAVEKAATPQISKLDAIVMLSHFERACLWVLVKKGYITQETSWNDAVDLIHELIEFRYPGAYQIPKCDPYPDSCYDMYYRLSDVIESHGHPPGVDMGAFKINCYGFPIRPQGGDDGFYAMWQTIVDGKSPWPITDPAIEAWAAAMHTHLPSDARRNMRAPCAVARPSKELSRLTAPTWIGRDYPELLNLCTG